MNSGLDLWRGFGPDLRSKISDLDPDLRSRSKISFERSFSSGCLRGELHPDVWRYLGGCSMFWVVNFGASAVGVFGVWIGTDMSDHGTGDGSGSCLAVAVGFVRPRVCSVAVSVRSFECWIKVGLQRGWVVWALGVQQTWVLALVGCIGLGSTGELGVQQLGSAAALGVSLKSLGVLVLVIGFGLCGLILWGVLYFIF
ncbi:hypothetical protein ACSBR2_008039 [Camellia fascicularis]